MSFRLIHGTVGLTLLAFALAGCEEGAGTATPASVDGTAAAPAVRLPGGKGDVEAPDIFSTTNEALWDGRPSLGGIWVAAPDAVNPERVLIRNTANGKSVTGALFRRERENPGPPLQMSSDAATALGLLAGQPATVSVVALRRAEEPVAEDPAAEGAVTDEAVAEAENAAEDVAEAATPAVDVAAVAAAAIDAADAPADADTDATDPATADAATVPAVEAAPPPRRGLFGGLFRRKPAIVDPGAPLTAISPDATEADAVPAEPAIGAAAIAPAAVETAPLDGAPAPTSATGATTRMAIGAFSVEANANAAGSSLEKAGFTATIQPGQSGGKAIWAVYASGTGDQAGLLSKIRALGFKDAYVVN